MLEGVGGKVHAHALNIQSLGSVSRPLTQHAFGGGGGFPREKLGRRESKPALGRLGRWRGAVGCLSSNGWGRGLRG